ncbi:hypothetical protein N9937_00700 [bacterium]|nr:hypothetical protein [bacterium]
MTFHGTTIEDAKIYLRGIADKGEKCPCCQQMVKFYRRTINSSMAFGLMVAHKYTREDHDKIFHVTDISKAIPECGALRGGGDWSKLRYWGLIDEVREETEDGNPHAGLWRITQKGRDFVQNNISVRKTKVVYDGKVIGEDGDLVGIAQALGNKFNYAELMKDYSKPPQPELFEEGATS